MCVRKIRGATGITQPREKEKEGEREKEGCERKRKVKGKINNWKRDRGPLSHTSPISLSFHTFVNIRSM